MKKIKENPVFVLLLVGLAVIVLPSFAISVTSITAVGFLIGVSIPQLFPVMFEAGAVVGGIAKAYIEIEGLKDQSSKNLANTMLYLGGGTAIVFNIYHVWEKIVKAGIPEGIIIALGHALPSIMVLIGAELLITVGKATFSGESLADKIKELLEKLSEAHTDHETTQKELQATRESNEKLADDKHQLTEQLEKFNNMPELLKGIVAVQNEDMELADFSEQYGFTEQRYTRLANEFFQNA